MSVRVDEGDDQGNELGYFYVGALYCTGIGSSFDYFDDFLG